MRIRTIKPEFFLHEELFDLERETGLPIRLAYAGVWCAADREGRFAWKVRTLKAQILPFDDVDFPRVLDALVTRGFLERYRCGDEWFGRIPTFKDHQFVNPREKASSIPDISEAEELDASSTREARVEDASRKEGKGKEGSNSMPPPPTPSEQKMPEAAAAAEGDEVLRQVEEVWSVWPRKIKALEAQREIVFAIRRDGFDAVLAGTKAIAAANAARNTVPVWKFMPDPVLFFQTARYHDDPAQYGDREVTLSPFQMTERIKVLEAEHRKHPGNPQSAAYDRATCTDAMRAEARMLADEIKKLKTSGSK